MEKEIHFECDCNPFFFGTNCEINDELLAASGEFLNGVLNDVKKNLYKIYLMKNIPVATAIKLIKIMNTHRIGLKTAENMILVLNRLADRSDLTAMSITDYISTNDYIMAGLYEELAENQRRFGAGTDIESADERSEIYFWIENTIERVMTFVDNNLHLKHKIELKEHLLFRQRFFMGMKIISKARARYSMLLHPI